MAEEQPLINYHQVIEEEDKLLKNRRLNFFGEISSKKLESTRFGIALSGGGIRSATINLGFLKTLNLFGILKQADYLSTVSGGGYTGAYIQATLHHEKNFNKLFQKEHIDHLRSNGEYMVPGKGLFKVWNRFLLVVSFLVSMVMSWISPAIILLLIYGIYFILGEAPMDNNIYLSNQNLVYQYGIPFLAILFASHFLTNIFLSYNLDASNLFDKTESGLLLAALLFFLGTLLYSLHIEFIKFERILQYALYGVVLILIGFLANPNALSFHRFYRKRLADAFLRDAKSYRNVKLKDLLPNDKNETRQYLAPYPLINTCLNLQDSADKSFAGTKASDYFLLSPLFCGSKLTKYVSTKDTRDYREMTLPGAVTISAAAVNPGMGSYSNRVISILTTLFNARLGFWAVNPSQLSAYPLVWWPIYFLRELFAKVGTKNKMVNISDGGHIENLGVYELLRRKCRLILAVDAGADPEFMFSDLLNLGIRARNEMGLDIRFRHGHIPDNVIKPRASRGYSKQRFSIGDIYQIWEEVIIPYGQENNKSVEVLINYGPQPDAEKTKISIREPKNNSLTDDDRNEIKTKVDILVQQKIEQDCKIGTIVYIKSSVTAPVGKPAIYDRNSLEYGTYKYRIYHPAFPHESTADQFFDPIQWEAYYQLGQYIAADVLGIEDLLAYTKGKKEAEPIQIEELIHYFDPSYQIIAVPVPEAVPEISFTERGIPIEETEIPESAELAMPPVTLEEQKQAVEEKEEPKKEPVEGEQVIEEDLNFNM